MNSKFLFYIAARELAIIAVAHDLLDGRPQRRIFLQQQYEGQSKLSFDQIAPRSFSKLIIVRRYVENIVGDLKRNAEIHSVIAHFLLLIMLGAGKNRADLTAS